MALALSIGVKLLLVLLKGDGGLTMPAAYTGSSGRDVREVGLFFRVLGDRRDFRHLSSGLALGVLVVLHPYPAGLLFDRLRSPTFLGVDGPTVEDFRPLVCTSLRARRHRGPSADLDTDLNRLTLSPI